MKKLLLAGLALTALLGGSAMAADLRTPAYKAPPPVPVFSWTGFYIGVHVGAGWGTKEWENFIAPPDPVDTFSSHTVNGFLGGGQIGFNYQAGWTVWGVEIQASAADLKGRGNCGIVAEFNCRTKVDGLATFAGRFGVTSDRTLVYVKAGAAWAHDKYDLNLFAPDPTIRPSSISDSRWGWMFGTGVEYAIAGNWSAKVEYNYMDFGTRSYLFNSTIAGPGLAAGFFDHYDITQRIHLIKFGINYRFGWGPVVASY